MFIHPSQLHYISSGDQAAVFLLSTVYLRHQNLEDVSWSFISDASRWFNFL